MNIELNIWFVWGVIAVLIIPLLLIGKKSKGGMVYVLVGVLVVGGLIVSDHQQRNKEKKTFEDVISMVMKESYEIDDVAITVKEVKGEKKDVKAKQFTDLFKKEYQKLNMDKKFDKEIKRKHYEFQVLTENGAYEVIPTSNHLMYVNYSDGESLKTRRAVLDTLNKTQMSDYQELNYESEGVYTVIMSDKAEYTVKTKESTVESILDSKSKEVFTNSPDEVSKQEIHNKKENAEGAVKNEKK